MAIVTPSDLLAISRENNLERLLRGRLSEKIGEKPFMDILKNLQNASETNTSKPAPSVPKPETPKATAPAFSFETPTPTMSFDEGVSRLRMVLGVLPAHQRRKVLPILVERMAKRLIPEDVEDFKTIGYGLLEEEETKRDALERYLPILLILSMMRSG